MGVDELGGVEGKHTPSLRRVVANDRIRVTWIIRFISRIEFDHRVPAVLGIQIQMDYKTRRSGSLRISAVIVQPGER